MAREVTEVETDMAGLIAEIENIQADRIAELIKRVDQIEIERSFSWRKKLRVCLSAVLRHPLNSSKRKVYRAKRISYEAPHVAPKLSTSGFRWSVRHPRKAFYSVFGLLYYILNGAGDSPVALKRRYRSSCAVKLADFLQSNRRITLKTSINPSVSIIIVLYNGAELTLAHLLSLQEALSIPCEVIIVDNGSTDDTHDLLSRVEGARVVFNKTNLHFLRAVNQAAHLAKGEFILLLNNDTCLKSDSIEIGSRILADDPTVGAVGAKIILLDGTLQEAGSIIWRDGSCVGYGRGRNPYDSAFQFRRNVDYCSGAFLMFRRSVFLALGCFDERFAPAYYEETDFCMRLWAKGLRVVYEPTIQVVHFEFGSSASSDEAIALQVRNRQLFCALHNSELQQHFVAGSPEVASRRRSRKPRMLIIDDQVPFPQLGAGFPRAAELIKTIHAAGWLVTLYPIHIPEVDFTAVRSCFFPEMEIIANRGLAGLENFLQQEADYLDAIFVSRPHNMADFQRIFVRMPKLRDLHVIYDAEALFIEREALRCKVFGLGWNDAQYRNELRKELALCGEASAIITVSDCEADLISRELRRKVFVIGHKRIPTPDGTPWEGREDILFVGSLSGTRQESPNIDGLYYFVNEVMPALDSSIGRGYRLIVAGRYESDDVRQLASDRVVLLGMVDDLRELYASAKLFIAPTRFAAGIPYKVHEASAFGIPIVATKLIATQVGRIHERDIMIGDNAQAFAEGCARLYRDKALWERVRTAAITSVAQECASERFDAAVVQLLSEVRVKGARAGLACTLD